MDRSAFRYQAYFCEENIWHFANEYLKTNSEQSSQDDKICFNARFFVLFFINATRKVTLLNQRVFGNDGIGIWDYHVVFFDGDKRLIFDFDTVLPFPSDAKMYLQETFPETHFSSEEVLQSLEMAPARIRIIPADQYVAHFSSDRSHMLDKNGLPIETFPAWDAIRSDDQPVDLKSYWNVDQQIKDSNVLDVAEFSKHFLNE